MSASAVVLLCACVALVHCQLEPPQKPLDSEPIGAGATYYGAPTLERDAANYFVPVQLNQPIVSSPSMADYNMDAIAPTVVVIQRLAPAPVAATAYTSATDAAAISYPSGPTVASMYAEATTAPIAYVPAASAPVIPSSMVPLVPEPHVSDTTAPATQTDTPPRHHLHKAITSAAAPESSAAAPESPAAISLGTQGPTYIVPSTPAASNPVPERGSAPKADAIAPEYDAVGQGQYGAVGQGQYDAVGQGAAPTPPNNTYQADAAATASPVGVMPASQWAAPSSVPFYSGAVGGKFKARSDASPRLSPLLSSFVLVAIAAVL